MYSSLFYHKQLQKRYMVSGSLCLISFIAVEVHVILVVIGQRPSGSMKGLWGSWEGLRANWEGLGDSCPSELAGKASEPAGRAPKIAGMASEPAGRAL